METVNSTQIHFETPFLILRTDQSLFTPHESMSNNEQENSNEDDKLFSALFGYPYRVNSGLEVEVHSFI
jgi:hypothetical protein